MGKMLKTAIFISMIIIAFLSCVDKSQQSAKVEKPKQSIEVDTPQKIIERSKKAVVIIKTQSGTGSGFIASPDGLIITNNHVVGNNKTVEIIFMDGRTTTASLIKKGLSYLDVAYLKVNGSNYDYLYMNTGCSAGDEVYAIGAPLGLSASVSKGIISNCNRVFKGVKFIQTDAAINFGNSGGPLINQKGEMVGLLTFKEVGAGIEGLNFALSPSVVIEYYENKLSKLEESLRVDQEARRESTEPDVNNNRTPSAPLWVKIGESSEATLYYNENTCGKMLRNKDSFLCVTLLEYKRPHQYSDRFYTKIGALQIINCREHSSESWAVGIKFDEGDSITVAKSTEKIYLRPNILGFALLEKFCR